MRQYTLNLDKKHVRPVVLLQNGITALLDTGAYIPVWTADEDILVDQLGAKFVCANAAFSGFGGRVHGNVYKVTINLNGILYPDMHIVAVKNDDDDYQMILSATMLDGLLYEIDTINHKLNITAKTLADTIRNLRIVSKEGKLFVLCNSNTNTDASLRTRVKAIVGEAYCDKVISLLPQSASVLNDESLHGAIAVAMSNMKS